MMRYMPNVLNGVSRRVVAGVLLVGSVPGAAMSQTIAITGATVYPVSGPRIAGGTVLIRDGKISAVGANVAIPSDAQRIDATGQWVTPGIFNAVTALGLTEIGAVDGTVDLRAQGSGNGVVASFKAWEGFNPASPLLQVTRNDGITTVGIVPAGNMIGGQAAVFDLAMATSRDAMALRAPAAMIADLGNKGPDRGASRGEVFERFRDVLTEARDFPRRRADYEKGQSRGLAARKADLEALQPVVQGRLLLVVDADRASDIQNALQLAKEFGLRIAISGATEAWKVADELAAAKVPVIVGSLNNIPRDFSMLGARQDNAAVLAKAGVRVIINEGSDAFNARNVKYSAGVAVSFGMSWDDALRAVTVNPAELFGVADRVGTLQPGKDATLVIWNGDPFELSTRPSHVMVRGRDVLAPSRQDELMRRYRKLPPDYRARP
ncbi:MAG: amidohydrolase family protein [Gemmatimonadaceae bacterium]